MSQNFLRAAAVVLAGFAATSSGASAQDYPSQPVTLTVGFAAGGAVDIYARQLAEAMRDHFSQPVVVVNKPGASGAVAARFTLQQPADGYTIYITNASSMIADDILAKDSRRFDTLKDFAPLGTVGLQNTGLFVPINSRFKTAADLAAYVKEHPGELRWSSTGAGSLHAIAGMKFLSDNGGSATLVPFQGGSQARNAVAGQQVDFGFMGLNLVTGFEQEVRALGMTAAKRDASMPDVQTFSEQGLPGMDIGGLDVVMARADLPQDIRDVLVKAIKMAAEEPSYEEKVKEAGLTATYMSPEESATAMDGLHEALSKTIAGL